MCHGVFAVAVADGQQPPSSADSTKVFSDCLFCLISMAKMSEPIYLHYLRNIFSEYLYTGDYTLQLLVVIFFHPLMFFF